MIEIVEYIAKGRFNSKEHGFYIIEHDAPSAEEVEIIEQIPFMQGQYDFSMLTGERIFSNRVVTVTFWRPNTPYEERKALEAQVKEELMLQGIDYIEDSWLRSGLRWYGKCKSVKPEDDASTNSLTLTVEFDVYPFALRDNISYSDVFDEDFFTDDSVDNWTGYYIHGKRNILLINIGANASSPTIKATSMMKIITDDQTMINVPKGESQDYFFKLKKGINHLTVLGEGHISFFMSSEVMV